MNLIVLTPDQKVFEGEITSVKVPGTNGIFEVLKGHAPLVSSLAAGEVRIFVEGGEKKTFAIKIQVQHCT